MDQDSIRLIGEPLPAGPAGWRRRMALLPPPARSLEEIHEAHATNGTSIGMFRPRQVERLVIERAGPWTPRQESFVRQQRLGLGEAVAREMHELEHLSFTFSYRFRCDDERCSKGHTLQILDWEIGESYRSWSRSDPNGWEEKIRQRYERELPERDLHLVVGNLAKHPHSFVIIGLVRPPRPEMDGGNVQQTLDLMGEQRAVTDQGIGLEAEQADALGGDEGEQSLNLFPDEG
jgi:hypothetical protein